MNEIIKEIATKAKLEHCVSHVRLQEFAELIVKECIVVLDEDDGATYHAELLEQYFGVEE